MQESAAREIDKSIGATVASIIEAVKNKSSEEYQKLAFTMNKGFTEYAHNTYDRCSTTKTLISRSHPVPISGIYVEQRFRFRGEVVDEAELIDFIRADGRVAVSGNAGCGKSLFMKSLFLKLVQSDGYGFPIFIELRHMKDDFKAGSDFQQFLFDQVAKSSHEFTITQFKFGLRKGAFSLLLDGFDELPVNLRAEIEKEILEISRTYPKLRIVVSSRPTARFQSWDEFSEARITSFSLTQVERLLGMIDFDSDKKSRFMKSLRSGLYIERKTFLSNPLLSTMMLLIFDIIGEIPKKIHIFYEKSFDVLTREHDTLKSRYVREMHCGLEIDEVQQIFEIFCALSYIDQEFLFNKEGLVKYISQSLELSEVYFEGKPQDLAQDFCESMSVLNEDAGEYSFVHRSFQEYFFAKYCLSTYDDNIRDIIFECLPEICNGSVFQMMHDMDPKRVECDILLPAVSAMKKEVAGKNPHVDPASIMIPFMSTIAIGPNHELENSELDFTINPKFRKDRMHSVAEAMENIAIIEDFFPFANLVVDDERHRKWYETHGDKSTKVYRNANKRLLQIGCGYFADFVLRSIDECYTKLSKNCESRSERRSKNLFERRRN